MNLTAALADAGRKILVIDLDPQHSASTWYQAILRQGRGAYDLFHEPQAAPAGLAMATVIDGVSIIPSSPLMYNVERALAGEPGAEHSLKRSHRRDRRSR